MTDRRYRSCTRKTRFKSEQEATIACSRLGQFAYQCEFCKGWHIATGTPFKRHVEEHADG